MLLQLSLLVLLSLQFSTTTCLWKQEDFLISFWVDPIVPIDQMDARYKEIADANFSVAMGIPFWNGLDTVRIANQIKLCNKYDMKAIIVGTAYQNVSTLPDDPVVMGYWLADEPNLAQYPPIVSQIEAIRTVRPNKMTFVNLLPNYAPPSMTGDPSYDDYVAKWAAAAKPDILCFDNYPYMQPNADTRTGYLNNLNTFRVISLQTGIPYWNFFNAMAFNDFLDPSYTQILWQVMASVAYGAKGILYFSYWEHPDFPQGNTMIRGVADASNMSNIQYVKGQHYYHAKTINSILKAWGPTLMKLTSTETFWMGPNSNPNQALDGSVSITYLDEGSGVYLLGQFKHSDGRVAVLLMNDDYNYSALTKVKFATDYTKVVEVCPNTGKEFMLQTDAPLKKDGFYLALQPSQGRLFVLNK